MKDRELEKQAAAIAQTYIYPLLEIKRDEFMEDARAEDQDDVEDQVRSYIQNELIPSIEALEHRVSDLPLGGGEDYTSEKRTIEMSDPVFNESDYAYLGRAVADAYRYALRRQRDSSPSSCSGFRCDCEGVEMGSYGNQIWVHAPAHMPKGNGYCLDACVAEEVMQLWMRGVTTHGCCCGHGEDGLAYIQVAESGISAMENLGYERRKNPMHPDARDLFIPRGVGHFSQNTPDPRRESGES